MNLSVEVLNNFFNVLMDHFVFSSQRFEVCLCMCLLVVYMLCEYSGEMLFTVCFILRSHAHSAVTGGCEALCKLDMGGPAQ